MVSFVLFAGFIATLVTVCVRQDVSLVSKDYYQEELAYQQQIDRLNNTAALHEKPVIAASQKRITIEFNRYGDIEKGELKVFCPSNAKMDKTFSLDPGQAPQFDMANAQGGMYRAKMHWTMDGKEYYQEEVIFL